MYYGLKTKMSNINERRGQTQRIHASVCTCLSVLPTGPWNLHVLHAVVLVPVPEMTELRTKPRVLVRTLDTNACVLVRSGDA